MEDEKGGYVVDFGENWVTSKYHRRKVGDRQGRQGNRFIQLPYRNNGMCSQKKETHLFLQPHGHQAPDLVFSLLFTGRALLLSTASTSTSCISSSPACSSIASLLRVLRKDYAIIPPDVFEETATSFPFSVSSSGSDE